MDKDYFHTVPYSRLIYTPQKYCTFSGIGEKMVEELIKNAPLDYFKFNQLLSLKRQREILNQCFTVTRNRYLQKEKDLHAKSSLLTQELEEIVNKEAADKGKKEGKPFFDKRWEWKHFVPATYSRTKAPRISTQGGTLHGMKREMSKEVLLMASKEIKNSIFVDIDLSAAHAHVAASLQKKRNTLLKQAVSDTDNFWDEYAAHYTKKLREASIDLDISAVRSILKICFYTSLNGGNPIGVARLGANLQVNAPDLLMSYNSIEHFENGSHFKVLKSILGELKIIEEVKELNKVCVKNGLTYTVDRMKPYKINSVHKGISRVLQGFEVLLLAVLTEFIRYRGGLPINLAHDGSLVLFTDEQDVQQICETLTHDLSDWSSFLLQGLKIKVEPKFSIKAGILYK